MRPEDDEKLGEPSLRVGGLRVWVHHRQFPDSADYWDGNWLVVTAIYRSPASWASATGAILHASELLHLLTEAERLYSSLSGTAILPCMEPNLRLEMKGNGRGQIEVEVLITDDHLSESHKYVEQIDQTHLPPLLQACSRVLADFPIKGKAEDARG